VKQSIKANKGLQDQVG